MDEMLQLHAKAARLRASMKEAADDLSNSAMTNIGGAGLAAGAATAGAGYGGRYLANQHLGPMGGAGSDLVSGLGSLRQAMGGAPPKFKMPTSKLELAHLFRQRGGSIGKAGLGIAGVGALAYMMGRNSDVSNARNAATSARGDLSELQANHAQLQGTNADLSGQLGKLREQMSGSNNEIQSLRDRLAAASKPPITLTRPQTPTPEPQTAREATRQGLISTAKAGISGLWNRISRRYGGEA